MKEALALLAGMLRPFLERAHVPYSTRPAAAAVLLSDGVWVPGVRVESASFGLTIPAMVNAFTTAYACDRRDIRAAVHIGDEPVLTDAWVRHTGNTGSTAAWRRVDNDRDPEFVAWIRGGPDLLPTPGGFIDPFLSDAPPFTVELARAISSRAWIPESDFPVGCVIRVSDGRLIPGVNVEHPDWTGVLCAERNAIGTMVTFGCPAPTDIVLSCPNDHSGTPCGACRQLLAEFARTASIQMDRGNGRPERSTPEILLPGAFTGAGLRH